MNRILIALFFCLSSTTLISQDHKLSLGISGGTTFSKIIFENYMDGNYGSSSGFGGELSCSYFINPRIFITTNLGFLQRGGSYRNETPVKTVNEELETSYFGIELITDYNYLNNDWLFGYQFGNEFIVSFSCGIFYSYYLNTLLNSRNYRYIDPEEANSLNDPAIPVGYSEDESSSRDRYEKVSDWDFGIVGGISLGYEFTDNFGLFISGKYHHGLQDITEMRLTEEVNMYNRSFVTFVGIKFRI